MSGTVGSSYPVHVDPRGALLAVELADVVHPVRRVFVVTDCPAGAERGHHRVPCGETVVLVSGGGSFWIDGVEHRLDRAGESLALPVGAHVRYCLDDPASTLLVLAEDPYAPHPDKNCEKEPS